ncbi:unnamed protein product [Miscanthus lutarioriparius]|uniref:BTB domain-containing protein n=1 Tax=Miscanthus lutarioriparius TaxID=422564 RepID=A0A811MFB5_9POAL|nr:unnamed protein product [Miscanthus lutarioriparius]
MSVSASPVGRSSGPPQPSSSSITAAAATGTHQLKIDGYSLTKSLPSGAHIKSSNFQAVGYSWYINYFPNGCGGLIKRARGYLSLQVVLDGAVAATAGAVMAQSTLSLINSAGLLEGTTARKTRVRFRAVKAAPFVEVPPPDLHRHLGELLFSGEASDVTLQAGGETFSAHRCVLAAKSPVFKAKLLGSMKEGTSTTNCAIRIEDIEPRVLQAVLHFMYTDTFPEVSKEEESAMSQHLLEAADRFSLQRLKLICEENLCGCIDTISVVTTLVLAEQHGCQGLKEKCFEFLKSTGLNALIATDGFNHLSTSCPAVLEELTSKLTLH